MPRSRRTVACSIALYISDAAEEGRLKRDNIGGTAWRVRRTFFSLAAAGPVSWVSACNGETLSDSGGTCAIKISSKLAFVSGLMAPRSNKDFKYSDALYAVNAIG